MPAPGFTSPAREHYEKMSRELCDVQRAYFMVRCEEDPAFMHGECFIVKPFTNKQGWRIFRALGQPIRMHG